LRTLRSWLGRLKWIGAPANPRETLKSATSPRLAVAALIAGALALFLAAYQDDLAARETVARERLILARAVDQAHLHISSHMAAAQADTAQTGGAARQAALERIHASAAETGGLHAGSLTMILTGDVNAVFSGGVSAGPDIDHAALEPHVRHITGLHPNAGLFSSRTIVVLDGVPSLVAYQAPSGAGAGGGSTPAGVAVYRLGRAALDLIGGQIAAGGLTVELGRAASPPALRAIELHDIDRVVVARLVWPATSGR
jgi:hypothetical protein